MAKGGRIRKAVYVELDENGNPVPGTCEPIERRKRVKPTDLSDFYACKIFAGEDLFGRRRQIGYVPFDIYRNMSLEQLEDHIRKQHGNVPLHYQLYGGDLQGSAGRFVPPLKTIYDKQPESDPRVAGVMQENELLRAQIDEQNRRIDDLTKMVHAGPVHTIDDKEPAPAKEKSFMDQFTESLGDAAKQRILALAPQLVDFAGSFFLNQQTPTMADENTSRPVSPVNAAQPAPEPMPATNVATEPMDPFTQDEQEKDMNYSCGYDSVSLTRDVPNSIINLVNDIRWKTAADPDGTDPSAIVEWMRGKMGALAGVKFKTDTLTQSKAG